MKILPHFVHRVAAFGILGAVLAFAYISNPNLFDAPKVESSTTVDVAGYAWANTPQSSGDPQTGTDQGLGWISFKGTATDGSPYVVRIDQTTGDFSGDAWSEHAGWIDFGPTSGYPELPSHGAKREGNAVTGWAKVLSLNSENANNGWIKMSGTATNGSPYGVTIGADGKFSGFAWGSDVIGWVDFAPVIAGTNGPHIDCAPVWSSCIEDSGFSCEGETVGTAVPGARTSTCGDVEACSTGKTCGSGGCTSNDDCGGGEVCLSGTGKCGSSTTGCGNGTCNVGESLLTCPQDCRGTIKQI